MLPFQGYRLHKPGLYPCSINQGKERDYIMTVIIQCGHCGGELDTSIGKCLSCGYPLGKEVKHEWAKQITNKKRYVYRI